MNAISPTLSSSVIAGLIPATHRATRSTPEVIAPWVAGINPAMTGGRNAVKEVA
jgi:hypothetical protein